MLSTACLCVMFKTLSCSFLIREFFSAGHGLPAGLAEVEMIERARAKRAW